MASTFATQVAALVLRLANGVVLARELGAAGLGIVAMALLGPRTLVMLLDGGVGLGNSYYASSCRLPVPVLVGNSLVVAVVASALVCVAALGAWESGLASLLLVGVTSELLVLSTTQVPFLIAYNYLRGIVHGLNAIEVLNRIALIQAAIVLAATLTLVLGLSWGAAGGVLAEVIGVMAALLPLWLWIRRNQSSSRLAVDGAAARRVLGFGVRGYLGNLMQFFNYRLDMFFVSAWLGSAQVGLYTIGIRLAELLWYFPNAVGFVLFPRAATDRAEDMNRFTPRVFRVTVLVVAAGGVLLAALGHMAIRILYGPDFVGANGPLLILVPGAVAMGAAKVLANDIAGRGRPEYNTATTGLALIATIGLDLALIPVYGIVGASIASSLAYAAVLVSTLYFFRRVSGVSTIALFRGRD